MNNKDKQRLTHISCLAALALMKYKTCDGRLRLNSVAFVRDALQKIIHRANDWRAKL